MSKVSISIPADLEALTRYCKSRLGASNFNIAPKDAMTVFLEDTLTLENLKTMPASERSQWLYIYATSNQELAKAKLEIDKEGTSIHLLGEQESIQRLAPIIQNALENKPTILAEIKKREIESSRQVSKNQEILDIRTKTDTQDREMPKKIDSPDDISKILAFPTYVTAIIWAFVGLIMWPPVLIRSHLIAITALSLGSFLPFDKSGIAKLIDYANGFYIRNFNNVLNHKNTKNEELSSLDGIFYSLIIAIFEFSFSCGFYYAIYLLLNS